jgi:hypothetical protein
MRLEDVSHAPIGRLGGSVAFVGAQLPLGFASHEAAFQSPRMLVFPQ